VGEGGENPTIKFHPHQRPSWVKKRRKMMSALLAIKKERENKNIY
jgi:hypothetical protein